MLARYLEAFDRDPRQGVSIGMLTDAKVRDAWRALRDMGAMRPLPVPESIRCRDCGWGGVELEFNGSEYTGYCGECGPIALSPQALEEAELEPTWLLNGLRAGLSDPSRPMTEIVADLLWHLGDIRLQGAAVDVLLARCASRDAEAKIAAALPAVVRPRRQLLLTIRTSVLQALAVPDQRIVAVLSECLRLELGQLVLDIPWLSAQLTPAAAPEGDVEVAPDGAWLRVNGRELRLHGKQRDFALVMEAAYRRGNRRPKLEWVLRQAGYEDGIVKLRQVAKRAEFFEFFGYGHGEVWISN